jgi:phage repressor protein C with HTH and peptisase S24 domain
VKKKNFTQQFEIIRNKFIAGEGGKNSTLLAFAHFLGHTHDGKVNAWKKGQWPSADDITSIHDRLGFAYRWLLTGEGEMFDDIPTANIPISAPDTEAENKELKAKNAALEAELREERALNRKLTARLLAETGGASEDTGDVAKAAGHE